MQLLLENHQNVHKIHALVKIATENHYNRHSSFRKVHTTKPGKTFANYNTLKVTWSFRIGGFERKWPGHLPILTYQINTHLLFNSPFEHVPFNLRYK